MLRIVPVKEKRSETVSVTLTPTVRDELAAIKKREDRSMSWIVAALMERGLEAYRTDRLLRPKGDDGKMSVLSAQAEETPRKKKKI